MTAHVARCHLGAVEIDGVARGTDGVGDHVPTGQGTGQRVVRAGNQQPPAEPVD